MLYGSDAPGIFAPDDISDLLWQVQAFLLNDLLVLDDIDGDIVINETENVQVHKINGALDLHDIFFAHLAALRIFDNGNAAVQLVQMEIFINVHTPSCLDVIQNKTFGNASYI